LEISELNSKNSQENHDCTALLDPQTATHNSDNTGFGNSGTCFRNNVTNVKLSL
jgi:hypothetical protein